jgi:hypothetical protein
MRAALFLALTALPALAEPIADRGYLLNCDGAWRGPEMVPGCVIGASGVLLQVAADGSDPDAMAALMAQDGIAAVAFEAEVREVFDVTASATVSNVIVFDYDPFLPDLRAIQGDWKPEGEATPDYFVRIEGMEWVEYQGEEPLSAERFVPAQQCADGTVTGGAVLVMYPMGGDPEATSCRIVTSAGPDRVSFLLTGTREETVYTRIPAE